MKSLNNDKKQRLEKMDEFFDSRLDIYDEHQKTAIAGAQEFYAATAALLPRHKGSRVLDLGCGTGLELEEYFALNPTASVTCIDLAEGMLKRLMEKFQGRDIEIMVGSYFDMTYGENSYDAAVSVESLHHYTKEQKTGLYKKIYSSLNDGGCFVLTDYTAPNIIFERFRFKKLARLKRAQGIAQDELMHFDTPLTIKHEIAALLGGGFKNITVAGRWKNTTILKAVK